MAGSLSCRRALAECVTHLASAIERGACTPKPAELETLAALCDEHGLTAEAARVRRWNPVDPEIATLMRAFRWPGGRG